jgi:hypothetical protein
VEQEFCDFLTSGILAHGFARLRLIATVEDPEAIPAMLAALAASREREGRAPPSAAGEPPSPAGVLGA